MIEPLRKRKKSSADLYTRRAENERALAELLELPRDQLLERAAIRSAKAPGYISSECLLHIVRARKRDNSEQYFNRLFRILQARVLSALPRVGTGDDKDGTCDLTAEKIRDHAFGRFAEMMSADREGYDERLDYFEVSFNAGMAGLRNDAMEIGIREHRRTAPIAYDRDTGELSAEVERARGAFDPFDPAAMNEEDYRLRLNAAIDALSEEQIRIVTMIANGIVIESLDPNAPSISKILGRSEKTIRTHRDRAYDAIRAALKGDRP